MSEYLISIYFWTLNPGRLVFRHTIIKFCLVHITRRNICSVEYFFSLTFNQMKKQSLQLKQNPKYAQAKLIMSLLSLQVSSPSY